MKRRDKTSTEKSATQSVRRQRQGSTSLLRIYESSEEMRLTMWVELMRTVSLMEREISALVAACGLTTTQFDVLATLDGLHGVTQQELAEKLLVTKGNVCGLIDRLEELGWVERKVDPEDARARRLYLTGAGRRKLQGVFPRHTREVVSRTTALSDSDAMKLRGLLLQLQQGIGFE